MKGLVKQIPATMGLYNGLYFLIAALLAIFNPFLLVESDFWKYYSKCSFEEVFSYTIGDLSVEKYLMESFPSKIVMKKCNEL